MSTTTPASPDDQERTGRPWTQPRFLLAAAALALLAVAALVLAVLPPRTQDAEPAPTPPAPTPSSTAAAQDASACGLPEGDRSVPVVPPAQTSWDLVGTMAAPTAPTTLGPGTITDGLRSCYARSPLGALYAATGFLAATTDPALRQPAVAALTLVSPGRDRALDLLQRADPGSGGSGVQVAGFSFLNYDATSAVIDVALRADGAAVHLPVSVRWDGGDWKVVLPDTGQLYEAIQPLPNLTGYALWSGA
ncbi:hypothetical protein [Quadrisphaera sp. INWT6]|uniref:hypothetical protein n=1 Tax=Quadrisphaera sp. INWT6 TaxID=2596917 RepID=UPI0018920226|nr:hypothetical protein [Quadrisphaera sp. INWT6]MBF5083758.1 hypothetical protein [Quadrisphaera sp. INWT6]